MRGSVPMLALLFAAIAGAAIMIWWNGQAPMEIGASHSCRGAAAEFDASRRPAALSTREECALNPKDTFRECQTCPEMVVIPAGSFTMGFEGKDEGPRYDVTIPRTFAVGKYPITVDEFTAFVKETGYDATKTSAESRSDGAQNCYWSDPGFKQGGSYPVVCVNWYDAKAYAAWLSRKTGHSYRLLTTDEWEYAARGQTSPGSYPRFFFGDDEGEMCKYANGPDQTALADVRKSKKNKGTRNDMDMGKDAYLPCADGYVNTSPVGRFLPNPFGLYDVHGNVWEWLEDCPESETIVRINGVRRRKEDCEARLVAGGAANGLDWTTLRAASRCRFRPVDRMLFLGFRLARSLSS